MMDLKVLNLRSTREWTCRILDRIDPPGPCALALSQQAWLECGSLQNHCTGRGFSAGTRAHSLMWKLLCNTWQMFSGRQRAECFSSLSRVLVMTASRLDPHCGISEWLCLPRYGCRAGKRTSRRHGHGAGAGLLLAIAVPRSIRENGRPCFCPYTVLPPSLQKGQAPPNIW